MSVALRLREVRARIDTAARASGRDPKDITLVAVSKTKSAELVREAYAAGQRAFGENYAQELDEKATALADLADIEWHFIGHLQSNKAKLVAKHAHVVHSVDSAMLARELGKRVDKEERGPLPVMLEVNVGGEAQKHGVVAQDLEALIRDVRAVPPLVLTGLMTMPPVDDLPRARAVFETLVTLRNLHGGVDALPHLSMGMTSDLEVAIACGATIVRVGTAIFGARTRD